MKSRWFGIAREHGISGAFVFLLLGVFAVFSTLLVLLSARLYRVTVEQTQEHNEQRVMGSYLLNVVRGNDRAGAVSVARFGETDVLCLSSQEEGERYVDYVYYWDGALREWFAGAEEEFVPEYGEIICEAQAFTPSVTGKRLDMYCVDGTGREHHLTAALYCASGEEALP